MPSTFPERVRVVFSEYSSRVSYAADLAERLQIPLALYAPRSLQCVREAGKLLGVTPGEIDNTMAIAIEDKVRGYFQHPEETTIVTSLSGPPFHFFPEQSIFVSESVERNSSLNILSPERELRLFRGQAKGPILIPLGDGNSSIVAATRGIALAKHLGVEIIFWHSTWHNDHEESSDPKRHVCASAQKVIECAERLGKLSGVLSETCRVECAPTIVEGIIHTALWSGASLIVMGRGKRKRFGAYADRVRARNCPVPLLMLAQEEETSVELGTEGEKV